MHNDPINRIRWVDVNSLTANNYNPNVVITPELRLLEHSILTTGWVQPVLVSPDNEIIDGFHRWALSRDSAKLRQHYAGKVPIAVVEGSRAEAMMLTVRINRAKGTHVAVRMSKVVRELIDVHGVARADVAKGIGATPSEVDLLYQEDVFRVRDIANAVYSKAWVPVESEDRPEQPTDTGAVKAVRRLGKGNVPVDTRPPSEWRHAPLDFTDAKGTTYRVRVCEWEEIESLRDECQRNGLKLKPSEKGVWFAAFDGDQVAGLAGLLALKPGAARMRVLYTREAYRGRGLGRILSEVRLAAGYAQGVRRFESIAKYPELLESFGFKSKGSKYGNEYLELQLT